jgi:chromosome segregation ATPase
MYEKQLDQIFAKKSNLEMQIMALESAASNKEVLGAMRSGATALQSAVRDTNIEKVDDAMDEINEAMALADELGEAMAQPIGPAMDEDELTSELQEMESEIQSL